MPTFRTRLAVAIVSAVTVALELMWMRILSLRFWHHFSYLVISTALLGFGASGTLLCLARRYVAGRPRAILCGAALLLALAVPLAVRAAEAVPLNVQFLAWDFWRQATYVVALQLIFLVPLLLAGTAVGVALMDDPRRIGGHYAANLIGSGIGAAATVAMLEVMRTPQVMIALAGLAWLAGAALVPWRRAAGSARALAAAAVLIGVHWLMPWQPAISQYKRLSLLDQMEGTQVLRSAEGPLGRIDVVANPRIHDAPGLSANWPQPPPPQVLMITDGDQVSSVYQAGSIEDYAFLDWTTQALPYRLLSRPAVLILGAGGGEGIGLAAYHGSRRILALEVNPQVISLMNGLLRGRGGRVYQAPNVEVANQEARGYLAGGGESFELIQLSLTGGYGAAAAGVQAGQEFYLATVEAFGKMLRRLSPQGMICVTCPAETPPRSALRVLATAAEAIRRRGLPPPEHLAMFRGMFTVSVVLFRSPISRGQLDSVRAFCDERGFDLCYLPGLRADEANRFCQLPEPYYFQAAQAILSAQAKQFFSQYLFDVGPVTDDRPYFFHFFRLRAWPEIKRQLGRLGLTHLELGYMLLLAVLTQSVPVAAVMIVLPLAGRAGGLRGIAGKGRAFAYFLLIGAGFMLLEMCFLQRLTLYLAHPLYSAAVVIGAFLVFGGIGSQLSTRWRRPARQVIRLAGLGVAALSGLYLAGLTPLLAATQAWPMSAKAMIVAGIVAPLAVCMGQMFPTAMRSIGLARSALVPWCWAVNGFASVVATVGATLLAIELGFTAVAALGAGAYLAAALAPPASAADPGVSHPQALGEQAPSG